MFRFQARRWRETQTLGRFGKRSTQNVFSYCRVRTICPAGVCDVCTHARTHARARVHTRTHAHTRLSRRAALAKTGNAITAHCREMYRNFQRRNLLIPASTC